MRNSPYAITVWLADKRHARITQPPKDVAVLDGNDAIFFCGVDGSPTPNVNFFLDGQPGRLSNDIGKIVPVNGGSLLRLFKVSSKQNGMKIECLASNHVGNDRSSANLKVYKYTDDVPSGFPKFTIPPKPLSVDVGKRVRLECEAEGEPPVAFLWLKNGVPVQNSPLSSAKESTQMANIMSQHYEGRSSLVIENVDVSDDGQYECLASNAHGAILSAAVQLRVRNTYYTPIILEKQDKVEVRPGKGANLTCTATGNPKPQVRWLTDQERTLTDSTEGKAMLFLTDVTEPRRYICEANNSLGTVQHLVRIEILG
ncbi:unnamed protein product [Schistocephalus solidus]|uniref:Peroxidasin n=1 Tax=Schistocephalus solidus TaxID=70667 RepID=A0A183SDQ5_SCHSO|nr:unnamed protein product [Schistocephalus solidus]